MEEVKNNTKAMQGIELMNSLVKDALDAVPVMSHEELKEELVNLIKYRGVMRKEKLNLERTIRRLEQTIRKKDAIIKNWKKASIVRRNSYLSSPILT